MARYAIIGIVTFFFLILILMPLSSMFYYSFSEGVSSFFRAVTSPSALFALKFSIILAISTALCNVVIGTLAAYALVRYDFPGKNILNAIVDLPIAVPTAVTGFTLLLLYGPIGLFGRYLTKHGITVLNAFPGILLAHVFVTFPFVIRAVSGVLEGVEKVHEEAAKTLGASRFQVFRHITLPAIKGGIVSGSILTFARSLGEFGATLMISGNLAMSTQTAPLFIYQRIQELDYTGASAMAIMLALASFAMLYGLKFITGGRKKKNGF
ncbi:MAG: sulfate ABC transporter permease subunit CysT [Candidatus Undinarchaeales archaeon]|nr:sulfate ABC transporter permease subunit CysT [Candidatus Undinarchaeales archaeon]